MTVFVSDFTAIISGISWSETDGTPTVLTYSFDTTPADYLAGTYSQAFIDSFVAFTATEQDLARQAMAIWAAVCGVVFVEVAPGEGDIRFGNYDFAYSDSPGAAGFAYYPGHSVYSHNTYDSQLAGDVFINSAYMNASWLLDTILHEIGHAIGLEHPHGGDIQLEAEFDSTTYTVMSYNGGYAPELGLFDGEAAAFIYGPQDVVPTGDGGIESFVVDEAAFTTTQVWGSAATDIAGTALHDIISAGGGNDLVGGFRGDDALFGEGGDDTLIGSEGSDTLAGGPGDDELIGGANTGDRSGTDVVSFAGVAVNVSIDLGVYESGDYVRGTTSGNGLGTDTLYGIDNAIGGIGHDRITGNSWGNMLNGGSGNDQLVALAGDDTLFGEQGDDTLRGNTGNDQANGGAGLDLVIGGTGRDTLNGGADDDVVRGNGGFDTVNGGAGNDLVAGGVQADLVLGGAGDDTLQAGGGFDTIDGGTGDDVLTGNFNADRFLFADGHGNDTITDFEATNNAEKIDLSAVTALNTVGQVLAAATQVGLDVLIDTGGGESILLQGVDLADLDANDFVF